jgi:hypothetical protein
MRLRDVLRVRNEVLLREIEFQVGKATPQLWHSYGTFPSGTKHTPEHTRQVEEIAGFLVNDDLLSELSDQEIGFLILACHFHDLGMSGTEEDNFDENSRNRVRREHSISIGDRIRQHWRDFGFHNETKAEILAEICKGHRPKRVNGVATWENLDDRRIVGPGEDVRVRVVAALVYAADELHIGEDRAPRREEEFNRIEDHLSRLHWRRHQAVLGPVLRDTKICFEGTVLTPVFENDLRKALRKAFTAVKELNDQLHANTMKYRCNTVSFKWQRKWLWALLIARVCSDLTPKSTDIIVRDTALLFENLVNVVVSISDVCDENDSIEIRKEQIRNSIDDFVTREFLIPKHEGLVLCDQTRTAQFLFDVARKADEAELHIHDQDRSQHESSLYHSAYGKRYIRQQLIPKLEAKYSIDLSMPGLAAHTKVALESSPTAARIADLIQPPDTVLVQSELFQLACLSGICGDLINDPELILNQEYRRCVDALVANAVRSLPTFMLFVKELAIIKNLTYQQVFQAAAFPAETDLSNDLAKDKKSVSFKLTQQVPLKHPELSIGYLLLARSRSDATISIRNTPKAPFQVKEVIDDKHELAKQITDKPSQIRIGPGVSIPGKNFSCRGKLSLDESTRTISLDFHRLRFCEMANPALIQFVRNKEREGTCNISFVPTEMTVGDAMILSKANSLTKEDGFTVKITIEGQPLIGSTGYKFDSYEFLEIEQKLFQLDSEFPRPIFIRDEDKSRIVSCTESDLKAVVGEILEEITDSRPIVTTFFLRYATVEGDEYYEEYLGMAPLSFGFKAPTVHGENASQSSMDELWNKGETDLKIESSYQEEMVELADTFREWTCNLERPFPFKTDNDLRFHYCKTRLLMVFHRIQDHKWYKERKVVFIFRPVSRSERYHVEIEYWRSRGDLERVELLNDLYEEAICQETSQINQTTGNGINLNEMEGSE